MASGLLTKEIESRIKQSPGHLFEVFLEIHEPINKDPPEILIKYPDDFSDQILKTAANFAYPCQIPSDEQSEHFTFVVLDSTGSTFRFGYCRRSNRESTCLCLISYYPWFDLFYNILNDLSQIINSKSVVEVDRFLSSLYDYKLMSVEEFYKHEGKETIEINSLSKTYSYSRPDQRKLPSMLSNRNFSVMFSRLGPDIMLRLFTHLIFERRILFISSKLYHLTACACECLHLINPMHWQSIFLPILPESMSWTTQCTAPFIIGLHSSIYSGLNKNELGDVVVINIDNKTIESPYDDLSLFPKHLIRSMKKGVQQSSQLAGDHLARVFLRTMAFIIGNYASGFVMKNEKLDFDRDVYLEQYVGSDMHTFMSSIANTQMFEQFSRYRTFLQFEREIDIDEFDIEVKSFEQVHQSKKPKTNKKIYKILEKQVKNDTINPTDSNPQNGKNKTANPISEQLHNQAEKSQSVITKTGQRVVNEALSVKDNLTSLDTNEAMKRKIETSIEPNHLTVQQSNSSDLSNGKSPSSSHSSIPEASQYKTNSLIDFDTDEHLLIPTPIVLNVVNASLTPENLRQTTQMGSKIKQLQNELQHKIQTFGNQRSDPRDEYGEQQKQIKKLVQQFDPLNESVTFRSDANISDRHPSLYETIPSNCVNNVLRNIQTNYGTNTRVNLKPTNPIQKVDYSLSPSDFDPLVSSRNNLYSHPSLSETNESNLIDFN